MVDNILSPERGSIWLSQGGLPQKITIQFSHPVDTAVNMIGFDCWHDYASNPKCVELFVSADNQEYLNWAILNCDRRAGIQLFQLDQLEKSIQYI